MTYSWDEENEEEIMEDRLNENDAWELGFEQGEKIANEEMIEDDDW